MHAHGTDLRSTLLSSQFARVAKGVDLRSTAGNCAWAQVPQLTLIFATSHVASIHRSFMMDHANADLPYGSFIWTLPFRVAPASSHKES